MSDDYRICTAIFRGKTEKAFFVDKLTSKGTGQFSIPRSLVHGADDLKIDRLESGDAITFRLREWKAEELGFA